MIFPVLEIEEKLQVNDMTRLNGSKSFVSKGSDAIANLYITPGYGQSEIEITDSVLEDRCLDWIFTSFAIDIDSTNNKIDFNEGGAQLTATLTTGAYTLATLATEIALQMTAAGGTYTCAYDEFDELTITGSQSFEILGASGTNKSNSILPHIGFLADTGADSSHEGNPTEYGQRRIALRVSDGTSDVTVYKYLKVYSVAGDRLFSSDGDLLVYESDILKWIPDGRSSFLQSHREAQEQILAWLDREGHINVYGDKFNKFDLVDLAEVKEWSKMKTLEIIFWNISNKKDDVFLTKHYEYMKKVTAARNRSVLRIDVNRDKKIDLGESTSIASGFLGRR